jgi:hypothetical protein
MLSLLIGQKKRKATESVCEKMSWLDSALLKALVKEEIVLATVKSGLRAFLQLWGYGKKKVKLFVSFLVKLRLSLPQLRRANIKSPILIVKHLSKKKGA